jgi:hypothetical protein
MPPCLCLGSVATPGAGNDERRPIMVDIAAPTACAALEPPTGQWRDAGCGSVRCRCRHAGRRGADCLGMSRERHAPNGRTAVIAIGDDAMSTHLFARCVAEITMRPCSRKPRSKGRASDSVDIGGPHIVTTRHDVGAARSRPPDHTPPRWSGLGQPPRAPGRPVQPGRHRADSARGRCHARALGHLVPHTPALALGAARRARAARHRSEQYPHPGDIP